MRPELTKALAAAVCLLSACPASAQDSAAKEDQKNIIVRFIPVAKSPRVIMTGVDENAVGRIEDEEAIPPSDLRLVHSKNKSQPIPLMLNVATRDYLVKNPTLTIAQGPPSPDDSGTGDKVFFSVTLPAEQGVFTVLVARRPGQKTWTRPVVTVLRDPATKASPGLTRLVNLSPENIGITAGSGRKIIPPLKQIGFSQLDKSLGNAIIYAERNKKWHKIRPVSGVTQKGMVQTIVCYRARPDRPDTAVVTCFQRNEDFPVLKNRVLTMDKQSPASPSDEAEN
ncbi:MAG: hypothetical protein H7A51_20005 [Akkermansiaceae bacterium]|nr:hypothetical protein [Akkermansiaceae bacterium]